MDSTYTALTSDARSTWSSLIWKDKNLEHLPRGWAPVQLRPSLTPKCTVTVIIPTVACKTGQAISSYQAIIKQLFLYQECGLILISMQMQGSQHIRKVYLKITLRNLVCSLEEETVKSANEKRLGKDTFFSPGITPASSWTGVHQWQHCRGCLAPFGDAQSNLQPTTDYLEKLVQCCTWVCSVWQILYSTMSGAY